MLPDQPFDLKTDFDSPYFSKSHNPFPQPQKNSVTLGLDMWIGINELVNRAQEGDESALLGIAGIALNTTRELETFARKRVPIIIRFARANPEFPFAVSFHPQRMKEVKELLDVLEVGKDCFIPHRRSSRWNPKDPITKIALRLIGFLKKESSLAKPLPLKLFAGRRSVQPKDGWSKKVAKLKPFSKKTVNDWWRLAKMVFLKFQPHPENMQELRRSVVTPKTKTGYKESEIRSKILEKLRRSFVGIAP